MSNKDGLVDLIFPAYSVLSDEVKITNILRYGSENVARDDKTGSMFVDLGKLAIPSSELTNELIIAPSSTTNRDLK